jgi:hypothetical protein
MNTNNGGAMFDNKKFIECPREEATHVYFAGNAHLIAEVKQDVFWCRICGECFHFYAPGKNNSSFYTAWYPGDAPASTQGPVFLKEKELEVKFAWSNYPGGTLAAEIAGVATALIVFQKQRIRKSGDPDDPNAIHFDDSWSLGRIKLVAADYARKIARGEL